MYTWPSLEISNSTYKRGTHMYTWPSLAVASPPPPPPSSFASLFVQYNLNVI